MSKLLLVAGVLLVGLVLTAQEAQSVRVPPAQAAVVQLQREPWQALAAVCLTPAFYDAESATPLVFDDGSEGRDVALPHDTIVVSTLGGDAAAATAKMATTYWKKAATVFVVDTYEQALWVVPSAALLSAPILVNPSQATLTALGTQQAVVVGAATPAVAKVTNLATKEDVWKYHLGQLAAKGKACDYIVMTNPHDADDPLNTNVQWPYLSLAAAPLAAFRQAVVQTGDYTGDRARLNALGVSLGDAGDKAKYEYVKPSFLKVKDESLAAIRFVAANGGAPQYLALVGGAIELPHYIIDLHAKYVFWNIAIDYVPADDPYGSLRSDTDFTRYVKPGLAVGRLLGDSAMDVSLQLVKTFFRKEYLPGGKYASLAPAGWEKKSIVYDGHRLNQPDEGGPDASPNEPFFPAGDVQKIQAKAGLSGDYVFPRDETKKDSKGTAGPDLFGMTSPYGFIQYVTHGDPPYMRIEIGRTGKDMKNYMATGPEFRKRLSFQAPTIAYVIGCNVGCILAPFKSNAEYLPAAAVHAGAAAFMAPNKCQSICFWRQAPKGPGSDQCMLLWQNLLEKKMPVGKALIDAKWQGYLNWKDKQFAEDRGKDSDNALEIDAPSMVLFGDPALRLD
jgi:hypothetical protein